MYAQKYEWFHMLKDAFDFVNRVSDVMRLKISSILKRAFPSRTTKFHGLSKKTLNELLFICVMQSHFVFNGFFYDQNR